MGFLNFAACFCEEKETGQWRDLDCWERARKCVTSGEEGQYKPDFISTG